MKKIFLLTPFLIISCATLKKSNTDTEIKKNESSVSTIEATKFSNSFTLEPVNLDKPILIGKDTIYNTRVIYNNSKETIVKKDTIVKTIDLRQEVKEKEKDYTKLIESLTTKLFLILIIMFVIVIIMNYIKKKVPLI
jgi:hypothetical protein